MCRNKNKSIYQLGWFIKPCKRVFVNIKCIVHLQIMFQAQLPRYKLDTSIIWCGVMVSTSDVSRQIQLRGVMGDERDFVWKWYRMVKESKLMNSDCPIFPYFRRKNLKLNYTSIDPRYQCREQGRLQDVFSGCHCCVRCHGHPAMAPLPLPQISP